ncbi:MAG: ABC transporter permease [Clostridiaceae bacterium]|jgi:ABC-type antimicrobial peptide transport system permease subunit|nr:ABC transporter permease [Clostridiaceae bacterium]
MFKLAIRNLIEKPLKLAAQILAVAFAVTLIFAVLSYKQAVYNYLYDIETLFSGDSDIVISYGAGDSRITAAKDLSAVTDIEYAVGVLEFYGLAEDEYVRVVGVGKSDLERVQSIEYTNPFAYQMRDDDAVISESFAAGRGLKVGDGFILSVMGKDRRLFVGAIAKSGGWFDGRAGFETVAVPDFLAASYFSDYAAGGLYNRIYVKLKGGTDADAAVAAINASGVYAGMIAERAVNLADLESNSALFSAPVTVAGVAALFLAAAIVVFLFALTFKGRSGYVSKLKSSGADTGQLLEIFLIENSVLAAVASLIGLALAEGVFRLLFYVSFGAARTSGADASNYAVAFFIGVVLTVSAGLFPVLYSVRKPIKESADLSRGGSAKFNPIPLLAAVLLAIAAFLTELLSNTARPYAGFIALILWLVVAVLAAPLVLKLLGGAVSGALTRAMAGKTLEICSPPLRDKAGALTRAMAGKTFAGKSGKNVKKGVCEPLSYAASVGGLTAVRARSGHIIVGLSAAGMAVAMLFVAAGAVTAAHFGSYAGEAANSVVIKGLRASDAALTAELRETEGVASAVPIFWREGEIAGESSGLIHIIGVSGEDSKELFSFEYITDSGIVTDVLNGLNANSVILDYSYHMAYGYETGDTVTVKYVGKSADFTVAGFIRSNFYVGRYVLCNPAELARAFGTQEYDSAWLTVSGDPNVTVNRLRAEYADRGWYVLTLKEIDANGNAAIAQMLTFINALSATVAAAAVLGVVMNVVLNRSENRRARSQFLSSGMSKLQLFVSELVAQVLTSVAAFVVALPLAAAMVKSVTDGVLLFGLYYGYEFNLISALSVSLPVLAVTALLPVILWYPRDYTIKIKELKV